MLVHAVKEGKGIGKELPASPNGSCAVQCVLIAGRQFEDANPVLAMCTASLSTGCC